MNNNIDINISNYENYVIDYFDGKLDAVELANFIAFLDKNPDIKEEIADLNSITLVPEIKEFTQKSKLIREPLVSVNVITELNYEEYFIAFHEGDLLEYEKNNVHLFIDKNPSLIPEFKLFEGLKIVPDADIVFPNKSLLTQKNRIVSLWFSTAAAAILILFAAYWFISNQQTHTLQHEFHGISEIAPKDNNSKLSQQTIAIIELQDRQLLEIETEYNSSEFVSYEDINISFLFCNINDEQLVNINDFARLAKQKETNITSSYIESDGLAAVAQPVSKKRQKSLIAKIFNSQKQKLANSIKFKKSKKKNIVEPAYIQVLDKGLFVFNTITGSETATVKIYNMEGELTSFQVEGQEVLFSKHYPEKSSQ